LCCLVGEPPKANFKIAGDNIENYCSINMMMWSILFGLSMNASTVTAFTPPSPLRTKNLVELSASSIDPKKGIIPEKSYGETSRKYRRTFFTHKDWLKHRSDDRFIRTVVSTVTSGVVRQLATEVGAVTATATFVVVWNMLTGGVTDFTGVHHDPMLGMFPNLELPLSPFTLSSPALGLLLGEYFTLHISTHSVYCGPPLTHPHFMLKY
jgi:hypothetical protein